MVDIVDLDDADDYTQSATPFRFTSHNMGLTLRRFPNNRWKSSSTPVDPDAGAGTGAEGGAGDWVDIGGSDLLCPGILSPLTVFALTSPHMLDPSAPRLIRHD